jgi:adenosylhomocysteine nucleosidase
MALPEEGGHHFEDADIAIVYSGVGKVNAAYCLTRALLQHKPKMVVNFGTAGSKKYQRGSIVAANNFIQRDMDVSPLGFTPGVTPYENTPAMITHKPVFTGLPQCSCATGDSFATKHRNDEGDVVDMEAYALAKICYLENIDFACAKFISDGADDQASGHWQESLKNVPAHFLEIFNQQFG